MNRPTKMRLPYGDSVDLLGGTRITVLKSADRHPDYFTLRLQRTLDEQEIESPATQPLPEEPLQRAHGEAPARDGGVGAPGPFSDALPQESEVIERVRGGAEDDLGEREVAFFEALRNAVDDLQFAYCAVRAAGCGEGNLTLSNDLLQACLAWGDGMPVRFSVSASLPTPDTEDDRSS